jgi:hypothetical protein
VDQLSVDELSVDGLSPHHPIDQDSQGKYFCKNTNHSVSEELAFATVDNATKILIYVRVISFKVPNAGTFSK